MGYFARDEDRQKDRKKEKKVQLDFFLLEKGRVLLKWQLNVGCDVYQMGWSKWRYSGIEKERERDRMKICVIAHNFLLLSPSFFTLWVYVQTSIVRLHVIHHSPWIFSFTSESDYPVIYFTLPSSCYLYGHHQRYRNCDWYALRMQWFPYPQLVVSVRKCRHRSQIPFCFWSLSENVRVYLYFFKFLKVSLK
jgi:hypothetical protein